jgi:homoaconitase/3-isopropylmalate dehydratase large subunit
VKQSLFDKIWESHVVEELPGGNALIFVDLVVALEITCQHVIYGME